LLNEAEKIVCRLEWASVYAGRRGEEELLQSCRVSPLHGYETEAAQLVEYLLERKAVPCGDGPFEALLQYAKQVPRKYTLRPDFGLEMTTPAREAVGRIVRTILEIAVSNVPGILEDLDTEFLHDYRICLRKIRSVLTLLKDVYPAEGTLRVRKILGDLARQTNRLRDLDVHLLAHDEYLGLLPPDFRPVMTEMFDDFSLERGKEVRRTLPKIRTGGLLLLEMGKYFSGESVHEPSRASSLAVGPLVFRSIYKRYRKIREIAAGIGAHTPDEAVHQVRIECKKLRYLMEFFGEFIPVEQGPALQKSLRRLQSRLGEFNDASVQQKSLMSYWEQKKPGSEVALGLGGLVSILYHLQQQSRALIEQALEGFCGDATAATFKHTFKLPANVAAMDVKRSKQQ
jgi:CHAD domain-containing protein